MQTPFGRHARLVVLALTVLLVATTAMAKPDTLDRDQIDDQHKWDLGHIYDGWEAWEADLGRVEVLAEEFIAMKGTLGQGSHRILDAYQRSDELGKIARKVSAYAGLSSVTDMANNEIAARQQQVGIMFSRFGTAMSWFGPELLAIPWGTMEQWLDDTPELEPYRFSITDSYRQQEHVLSAEQEELLSYFNQALGSPGDIYTQLSTSDITYPEVELTDGTVVTMTPGQYYQILGGDYSQEDRKRAFKGFYGIYNEQANTYASIYNGILQGNWARAQARNYPSSLKMSLDGNDIPTEVYENLVEMVREGAEPVHRYYALRKKALGLDTYHGYDGNVPLVDFHKEYPWEDIRDDIVESVQPLGRDYVKKMKEAFSGGWVDVYENEGKRTGAFSAGVYGVHPYMLLNYNDTMDSFFTAAHEMGHTLHTMLSHENQPYATSDYTIFVAEVASTLNERLLLDQLLAKTDDPTEQVALLTHAIDDIISTFYSQVMFADFELQASRLVEQGVPITRDVLTQVYSELWKNQSGPDATFDEPYGATWSRISHFYNSPFYVYQYATCYASSAKLYEGITSTDSDVRETAVAEYLELLKSGGNDHPMNQLKKAGVDLSDPGAFQAVIDNLDRLVTLLDEALQELEQG